MEFLSEKFALKSPPSKNSDFYMGTGGALEHVMETLDNESFYGKATAGKCVQAFGPLPRAEHHVRLDRTSPCQDSSGKSPAPRLASSPQSHPYPYSLATRPGLQTEPGSQPSFPEVRFGAGRSKEMWEDGWGPDAEHFGTLATGQGPELNPV